MTQKKPGKKKVLSAGAEGKKVKPVVRDLKPKKDAKGGVLRAIESGEHHIEGGVIEAGTHHLQGS